VEACELDYHTRANPLNYVIGRISHRYVDDKKAWRCALKLFIVYEPSVYLSYLRGELGRKTRRAWQRINRLWQEVRSLKSMLAGKDRIDDFEPF
jgi:hypothetical protein